MRPFVTLFSLIVFMAMSLEVSAQRRHKPLYNIDGGSYKPSGWHFSPGLTYAVPFSNTDNRLVLAEDTVQNIFGNPGGKLSVYLGIGRHHLLDKPYLDMIDYGVAYKRLSMTEEVSGNITEESTGALLSEYSEDWSYQRNHISAYLNLSKWIQIADYQFISTGLGLNFDYNVADNAGDHADFVAASNTSYPANFWGQIHYKIGFGWKANPRLFIMPELEIPLMTVVPTEYGALSFPAMRSEYIPLVFSLKFAYLSKRPQKDCVGKPDKKTGHELWGPKMRRKRN